MSAKGQHELGLLHNRHSGPGSLFRHRPCPSRSFLLTADLLPLNTIQQDGRMYRLKLTYTF